MRASEYRMIRGSLDPWGTKENPVCARLSGGKMRPLLTEKPPLIKDAAGVGIMLLNSLGKSRHAQVRKL